mmetsp:Transcript_15822/g.55084  ORF Transcript_15822/g.55084 Transcript_15822/m.55084 type:complete len:232 (+) Transcript_15822:3-698(+)
MLSPSVTRWHPSLCLMSTGMQMLARLRRHDATRPQTPAAFAPNGTAPPFVPEPGSRFTPSECLDRRLDLSGRSGAAAIEDATPERQRASALQAPLAGGSTVDAAEMTVAAAQASDLGIQEAMDLLKRHCDADACWILVDGRVLDVTALCLQMKDVAVEPAHTWADIQAARVASCAWQGGTRHRRSQLRAIRPLQCFSAATGTSGPSRMGGGSGRPRRRYEAAFGGTSQENM